jgi:nicotinamide mononucleotide transporter
MVAIFGDVPPLHPYPCGPTVSTLELVAAVVGALSVYLSVRQNIWSWPTGIVNVVLYAVVFHGAKLYADMGLQVIYAVISVYGWYEWKYGGENRTELRVSRTGPRLAVVLAVVAITGSAALGLILRSRTDASLPFLDATLSTTSLVAQWMMTRKKLENWLVWILVDIFYVGMFLYKDLHVTAVLYTVFLALAVKGFIDWRRSMHTLAPLPA